MDDELRSCPRCGCRTLLVRVQTWADFYDGRPHQYHDYELPYVMPIEGGDVLCPDCHYEWEIGTGREVPIEDRRTI
jgi:hypothetical protein